MECSRDSSWQASNANGTHNDIHSNGNGQLHMDTRKPRTAGLSYPNHPQDDTATDHGAAPFDDMVKGPVPSLPREWLKLFSRPRRLLLTSNKHKSALDLQPRPIASTVSAPRPPVLKPEHQIVCKAKEQATQGYIETERSRDRSPSGLDQESNCRAALGKGKAPALDHSRHDPGLKDCATSVRGLDMPVKSFKVRPNHPHPTSVLDGKYFVSEHMPIPKVALDLWENRIRDPLKQALLRMSTRTDDYEAYSVIEFYMAGKRKDRLKPSVIITCCSKTRKKELRRIIDELNWLKSTGVEPIIIVDKSFGYRTQASNPDEGLNLEVEGRNLRQSTQTCGIQARLLSGRTGPSGLPSVSFTIGGFIMIEDQIVGLTTAHPLFPFKPDEMDSSDISSTDTDEADISDLDTKSLASLEDKPDSVNGSAAKHPSEYVSQVFDSREWPLPEHNPVIHNGTLESPEPEFQKFGRVAHFALNSSNSPQALENDQPQGDDQQQDWAIVSVRNSFHRLNSVRLPGDVNFTYLLETVTENERPSGKVWVITGHGPVPGVVSTQSVSIQLGQSSFDVQQITMDRCIGVLPLTQSC